VVIDVSDTGPAFRRTRPKDIRALLFHQGYRPRHGLGLSICKKIMEEHRGSIRVSATAGGGATSASSSVSPVEEIFKAQCWEVMRCGVDTIGMPRRSARLPELRADLLVRGRHVIRDEGPLHAAGKIGTAQVHILRIVSPRAPVRNCPHRTVFPME